MRGLSLCCVALILLGSAISCDSAPSDSDPAGSGAAARRIVIVTLEGWWHEGVGDPLPEGLRQAGRVVDDAMTSSTQLRAAVASALSGSSPERLDVRGDLLTPLGDDLPYLSGMLAEAGWTTGAFVANPLLGFGSGFERGFDVYDADDAGVIGPLRHAPETRPAEMAVAHALEWLGATDPTRSAFAWIHLVGVQLRPSELREKTPEPADRAAELAAALERLDRELFQLLPDATLIVAGLHGRIDPEDATYNAFFLDPTVLRIPFVYRGPDIAETESVWLPDVAAMILTQAGVEAPLRDGRFPRAPGEARRAFVWSGARDFGWPVEAAVLADGVLSVGNDRTAERNHWNWNDGSEAVPSSDPFRSLAEQEDWKSRPRADSFPEAIGERLSQAGVAFPDAPPRPDPANRAVRQSTVQQLIDGRRAALSRFGTKAATSFLAAREVDPANVGALVEAGEALVLSNRTRKAFERLGTAINEDPWRGDAWHWMAHVAFQQEAIGRAEAMLLLSDHLEPDNADVLYDLACARSLNEDLDGADSYLRRAWEVGFRNVNYIQTDPDLASFRTDPRFARFMREVAR